MDSLPSSNQDIVQAIDNVARSFTQLKSDKITVSHQADTTNSTVTDAKIMVGVGRIAGSASTTVTETLTFPSTFNSPPIVLASSAGFLSPGGTYSPTSVSTAWSFFITAAINPSTSAVTIRLHRADGASFSAGTDYYYQWIAIGN